MKYITWEFWILVMLLILIGAWAAMDSHAAIRVNIAPNEFTQQEISTINQAVTAANKVLAMPEFKTQVMSIKFDDVSGKSNEQVYQTITQDGQVTLKKWKSGVCNSCVAQEGNGFVSLSDKAFKSVAALAGTTIHEFSHSKGFRHAVYPKSWFWPWGYTQLTIPYALGNITVKLAGAK